MTCHGQRGEFTESRGQEANGKIKAGTGDGGHGQRLCAGLEGGGGLDAEHRSGLFLAGDEDPVWTRQTVLYQFTEHPSCADTVGILCYRRRPFVRRGCRNHI